MSDNGIVISVAVQYVRYYRSILKRIADGWPSPASLASTALDWDIHAKGCGFNKDEYGECDCNAEENRLSLDEETAR